MAISSIFLSSFRNHKEKKIEFCKGLTVIWGENGSGKTSVLEAIHTLSMGKSFRTHRQKTLIKNGEKGYLIKGCFSNVIGLPIPKLVNKLKGLGYYNFKHEK